MFCSHCGKRVLDTMLFCPFCGEGIVIPDQETETVKPAVEAEPVQEKPEKPRIRLFDDPAPDFDLPPIEPEEPAHEETPAPEEVPQETVRTEPVSPELDNPTRLTGRVPNLTEVKTPKKAPSKRNVDTTVPTKSFNPNNIFLEDTTIDDYDDDIDDVDDDDDDEGFFSRHTRGLVAVALFLVVLIAALVWTMTPMGQRALAGMNFAWRASAYNELGLEAYEAGNYGQAAQYYSRAFSRDGSEYTYANNAAIAFFYNGETDEAIKMIDAMIAIDPGRSEAYELLLAIYPNASARPWDVVERLRKGYQATGNAAYNVS